MNDILVRIHTMMRRLVLLVVLLSAVVFIPRASASVVADPVRVIDECPRSRAVIPAVLVGGPLAMLALFFPAVFGGWKRWLALLSAGCTASTLYFLQWCAGAHLGDSWLGTPAALWTLTTGVYLAGLVSAWQRHLHRVQVGEAPLLPGWLEITLLGVMSAGGLAWILAFHHLRQSPIGPEWWPVAVLCAGVWLGAGHAAWTWLRGPRLVPALASEAVVLTGLVLASIVLAPEVLSRGRARGGLETAATGGALAARLVWTFRVPLPGAVSSSPLVTGDRVYIAAAIDDLFRPYGVLYCLDRATGKLLWSFDDGRKMKPAHSSPVLVAGRLYIGEGLHQDLECKLYCLDARTGERVWDYQTASHTESTPVVQDGRVYFGAGDDGLYCLDAAKGSKVWNFPAFHIDATPLVANGRIYAGAGIGDVFKTTALLCLDAVTGKAHWRYNTDLPVWSRPIVSHGQVYLATGNGRLNESDPKPAGAVLCLRETDGGRVWKRDLPDGALGRMAADRDHLYLGCRDGFFYCLRRRDGEQVWRRDLGSPLVTGAVLEVCPYCESSPERLYAVSLDGLLVAMQPRTGELLWEKEIGARQGGHVEVISTPAFDARDTRRLYVAFTVLSAARSAELHCYEEARTEPPAR